MWADLKMNHVNTSRSRGEIIVFAVALVLIGVLLTSFATLARSQVQKAEMREALLQSQRIALTRCSEDSPTGLAMRACMSEVRLQTAQALEVSYGLAGRTTRTAPMASAHAGVSTGMSLVSLR